MRRQKAVGFVFIGLLACAGVAACTSLLGDVPGGNLLDASGDVTMSDGQGAEASTDSGGGSDGAEAATTDSGGGVDSSHADSGAPPADGGLEAEAGDPVVQIAAGGEAACAVTQSGNLYCWGNNQHGGVGDGTTTTRSAAVHIAQDSTGGTLGAVAQVSAGFFHTCAQMRDNTVYCWGNDDTGQLGDGIFLPTADAGVSDQHRPQRVPAVTGTAVYSGAFHVCVPSAGNYVCWGSNTYGELGHAPNTVGDSMVNAGLFVTVANSTPLGGVQIPGSTTASFGYSFGCANNPSGQYDECWGSNSSGQLGNVTDAGQYGANPTPTFVSYGNNGVLQAYHELAASAFAHACALDGQGNLSCWGSAGSGQLGPGVGMSSTFQQYAVSTMSNVSHVAVGLFSTCVVDGAEHVQCFGDNGQGQLGHDPTTDPFSSCRDNSTPCNPNPSVVNVGGNALGPAKAISLGLGYACALKTDGTVWCWGAGALGGQDAGTSYVPVQISGLP